MEINATELSSPTERAAGSSAALVSNFNKTSLVLV